jgi:hypoxanthine phosphoribosyltransferase
MLIWDGANRGGIMKQLFSEQQIQARVKELAEQISKDYKGRSLAVICVLKGAFIFMGDLIRQIDQTVYCDFLQAFSYKGTQSTGEVTLDLDIFQSIEGKHVLLVEDIIDTGKTLSFLIEHLKKKKPASLKVCALVYKQVNPEMRSLIDYLGFTAGNEFIVGYGIDYEGMYRSLPYIAVL